MPQPTLEQFDAYEQVATTISNILDNVTPEELHFKSGQDEWSINEIITHLADTEVTVYTRLRKIIAEDQPTLQIFHENLWAAHLEYQRQDAQLQVTLFTLLRRATVNLLTMLPAETWKRTGIHPERGTVTLYNIFETYLQHGQAHLRQIEGNLKVQEIKE